MPNLFIYAVHEELDEGPKLYACEVKETPKMLTALDRRASRAPFGYRSQFPKGEADWPRTPRAAVEKFIKRTEARIAAAHRAIGDGQRNLEAGRGLLARLDEEDNG